MLKAGPCLVALQDFSELSLGASGAFSGDRLIPKHQSQALVEELPEELCGC